MSMAELSFVARFHAAPGRRAELEAAFAELAAPTRSEPGCLAFEVLAASADPDLFFIHSRWRSAADFDRHAELAHTRRFLAAALDAIDHPFDGQRLTRLV